MKSSRGYKVGKYSSVKSRGNGLLRLTLVRHGQTPWNREQRVQGISDISLSNRGLAQAKNLALALKNEKIETILSSPLRRALQTAEAINRFHGLSIERNQDLIELDQGDFEGQTFPEIMKTHKAFLEHWAADPASVIMPNGEITGAASKKGMDCGRTHSRNRNTPRGPRLAQFHHYDHPLQNSGPESSPCPKGSCGRGIANDRAIQEGEGGNHPL